VLADLIDKSLLVSGKSRFSDGNRLSMLMSVQQFAANKLATLGTDGDAVALRHSDYFSQWTPENVGITFQIEEVDNLMVAAQRALRHGAHRVGVICAEKASYILDSWGPIEKGIEFLQALRTAHPSLPDESDFTLLLALSSLTHGSGHARAAKPIVQQALKTAHTPRHRLDGLIRLGHIHRRLRELDDAMKTYREAELIAQQLNARRWLCSLCGQIGLIMEDQGHIAEAQARYQEAIDRARALNDSKREEMWMGNLGISYAEQGYLDRARPLMEGALERSRQHGDRGRMLLWLGNLGVIHQQQENFGPAIATLEEAVQLSRVLGDRQQESLTLGNLSVVYTRQQAFDKARSLLDTACDVAAGLADRSLMGVWFLEIGDLESRRGNIEEARSNFEKAESLFHEGEMLRELVLLTIRRAKGEVLNGHNDLAEGHLDRAAVLAEPFLQEGDVQLQPAIDEIRAAIAGDRTSLSL